MAKRKFIRTDSKRFSKVGKNRKKLQKWRRARGRDNKIRENRAGRPKSPRVGYKTDKKNFGKIQKLEPCLVYNLQDLKNTDKNSIIVIGKIGAKKRFEIIKKAADMKLKMANVKEVV